MRLGGGDRSGSQFGAMRCDAMRCGRARQQESPATRCASQSPAATINKRAEETQGNLPLEANLVGNFAELSLFLGLEPGV